MDADLVRGLSGHDSTGVPPSTAASPLPTEPWQSYPADEIAAGPRLAAEAIDACTSVATLTSDRRDLIVTHAFLIGWFVRHALDAPEWRWLGLNAANAALAVIRCTTDRPPMLASVNDMAHLPPDLRWTGFPDALKY